MSAHLLSPNQSSVELLFLHFHGLGRCCWLNNLCCYCYLHLMGLVFWNSIHLEVASDSFSFLINSSWLLVFMISWKGIYFSYNLLHIGLIFSFHYWFRDLLREFYKKYEVLLIIFFLVFLLFLASEGLLFVSFFWTSFHSFSSPTLGSWPQQGFYLPDPCELTFANTLLLSNAAISLGNSFISLEISSQFFIFFSFFSFILAWTFISLQIKEFRIMGLSINDSVYSCLFFFLTGLHFFHLVVGLFLCCVFFWSCSFSSFNNSGFSYSFSSWCLSRLPIESSCD